MKSTNPTRASTPALLGARVAGGDAGGVAELEEGAATTRRPRHIPDEPMRSRGLRPNRSTQNTATRVASTLTAPTAHRAAKLWLTGDVNPAAAKMVSA